MLLLALRLPAQAPHAAPHDSLVHLQQLLESGDLAAAQTAAEASLARFPRDGGVENILGIIALQRRNPSAAATRFQQALHDEPSLTAPALNLARLYLEFPGDFPDPETHAGALYRRVLRLDPHSDEALVQLAFIDERHGSYAEAAALLRAVSPEHQNAPLILQLRCAASAATGQQAAATEDAKALQADPELTEPDVLAMAPGLRAGRRADLLVALLASVAQRQPLTATGLQLLGLAHDAAGDPAAARATLEQAYAFTPQSTQLLADLALVAEHQGDPQAALGYLAHARELAPQNAALAYEFGQVCIRMKLLGEARNAIEAALKLDPRNPDYNLSLAKVTALSQDPLRAVPYLETYHALRPTDPNGLLLLGIVQFRVKDFEAARKWLDLAAQDPSTRAQALLTLGSADRQQGQMDASRTALTRSAALDPRDPEVHAELGMLALQTKDIPTATRELEQAVTLEPENFTANFGLLQLYAQTHDPRRPAQLARFEKLKDDNETLNRQAMRVIQIQPGATPATSQP